MPPDPFTPPKIPSAAADNDDSDATAAKTVCVVEDDEGVRDSMTTLLEAHHFAVTGYPSGTQFLADRQAGQINCLIIDQHMPGLDGLEVVAALQRQGFFFPTILVTGRPDDAITRRAGALGISNVLLKPFRMGQLIALVESVLAGQG